MDYPQTLADFLREAQSLTPPVEVTEPYFTAAFSPAVPAVVGVFDLLKERELDQPALRVLIGAAALIRKFKFHGKQTEAAVVFTSRVGELAPADDGEAGAPA